MFTLTRKIKGCKQLACLHVNSDCKHSKLFMSPSLEFIVPRRVQRCHPKAQYCVVYSMRKVQKQIGRLYLDNGLLVWNGIGVNSKDAIQKYLLDLPASEHVLQVLDAQPVVDEAVSGQLTFLIQTAGTVKYQDTPMKPFQQNFIITAQGDKWKIVSDCYRIQDSLCTFKGE